MTHAIGVLSVICLALTCVPVALAQSQPAANSKQAEEPKTMKDC
jgi:hypothetical protein